MTKFQRIIEGGAPYLAKVMAKMTLNLEIEMSVLEKIPMNEREQEERYEELINLYYKDLTFDEATESTNQKLKELEKKVLDLCKVLGKDPNNIDDRADRYS
jgi:hypothetical protein